MVVVGGTVSRDRAEEEIKSGGTEGGVNTESKS